MESIKLDQTIAKNADFIEHLSAESGQPVSKCYQCGKCTAGCPVAIDMDFPPQQVLRMSQLGMKDELLKSNTIWMCVGCETCSTRCPCNIDIPKVMESLRIMAWQAGTAPAGKAKDVEVFYSSFLNSVEKYGRLHEVGLILENNLRSKKLFNNAELGLPMMQKGKIKLSASKVKGQKEIARIFAEARRMEGEGK